jgi:hypothetical protein
MQALPVLAMDITVTAKTSGFAFGANGVPNPSPLRFGGDFTVEDQLSGGLLGQISLELDPECGNMLKARGVYRTKFLEISAGPSFGILNASGSNSVTSVIQPGLGIGFNLIAPGVAIAKADTDFALPTTSSADGRVFLQKSSLSAGIYLPNAICSFGISQKTATESGVKTTGLTDIGIYTEAFQKGSTIRISLDFIYRVMDYYIAAGSPSNRKTGHLVLGGGLNWEPTDDLSFFVKGDGSLYSFSLGSALTGLDKFLFDVKVGMRYRINTSQD